MKTRIKELRTALGLKQRELAEKIGVTTGLVGNWESGLATPGANRIHQICEMFDVREKWLRDGSGVMFEKDDPGPDVREIQERFCRAAFDSLPAEIKRVIVDVMRDEVVRLAAHAYDHGTTKPTTNVVKSQTNNGFISGDMIQE